MSLKITFDGKKDYTDILQNALNKGGEIFVEEGFYYLSRTLKIHSDTKLTAHNNAVFFTAPDSKKKRDDFLLTNADKINGNSNISISGGVWEGNCTNNPRGKLFGGGYTGTMLDFFNVKGLSLKDMRLKNPQCYYVRLSKVEDFDIDGIFFDTEHILPNQDGIHLGGFCKNGSIKNLKGSHGSPNDDFVAFNADDCLTRLQNLDILCGPIENVSVENLYSPLCHSFIRMLSVDSAIKNIQIKNMQGCCKAFAVNMDGARYCKPLTRLISRFDGRYYRGCGEITNVKVQNVNIYSQKPQKALFLIESNVDDFVVENFDTDNRHCNTKAFSIGYNHPLKIEYKLKDQTAKTLIKKSLRRVKLSPAKFDFVRIDKSTD